jgi:hypothetical protein
MSTANLDKETRRQRRGTKAAYIAALSFYPIAAVVIVYLSVEGFVPIPLRADSGLDVNTAQILFIVVSLVFLIVGLFWPRLAKWHKKECVNDIELAYGHVVRATFLSVPSMYGIIMSMLGGSWYIVALMLVYVLGFAALIWTFPTEKRLAKWRG